MTYFRLRLILLALVFSLSSYAQLQDEKPAVIAFISDQHGNFKSTTRIIDAALEMGATHFVFGGDWPLQFIDGRDIESDLYNIREVESYLISTFINSNGVASHIPRENIIFNLGNWDNGIPLEVFENAGSLFLKGDKDIGIMYIGGRYIQTSHRPLYLLNKNAIPRKRLEEDYLLRRTQAPVDNFIDLVEFSHTHELALYMRKSDGKVFLNPGSVGDVTVPKTFAMLDTKTGHLKIYDINSRNKDPIKFMGLGQRAASDSAPKMTQNPCSWIIRPYQSLRVESFP